MTKADHIRIAEEIIAGFSGDMLATANAAPEDWNGYQLRMAAVLIGERYLMGHLTTRERNKLRQQVDALLSDENI